MREAVRFNNKETDWMDNIGLEIENKRGSLIGANISDLHIGKINPKTQYEILKEQFINEIDKLPKLDYITVAGDYYDHKIMANSSAAMYGSILFSDIVNVARSKNATIIVIAGTESHDNGTIRLFSGYLIDNTVDVRIVEKIKFEIVKGAKILCIPELYGIDENIYNKFLFESGWYDICIMHGTIEGAVYGNNVGQGRLFRASDFIYCTGYVISGHIHVPGCFNKFFYYCGSPVRWQHGEEQEKGFFITYLDLDTRMHYAYFSAIKSFVYKTVEISDIVDNDPQVVINYIEGIKEKEKIDYLRVKFLSPIQGSNKVIINNYYKGDDNMSLMFSSAAEELKLKQEATAREKEYNYILDNTLTDYQKFVIYVNQKEGEGFITVDELKELLLDEA